MSSKNRMLFCALLAAVLVSLTGLTFSYVQENTLYDVGEVRTVLKFRKEDGDSGIPVLETNSVLNRETWVENTGEAPCYVRIKLSIPKAEGADVIELGTMTNGLFLPLEAPEKSNFDRAGEYWTKEGEYLYYRNRGTQNVLLPKKATPPVFSAIRVNPDLKSGVLAQWTDCEIPIFTQAIQTGVFDTEEEAWEDFDRSVSKNGA